MVGDLHGSQDRQHGQIGPAARRRRADDADAALAELFSTAYAGLPDSVGAPGRRAAVAGSGVALVVLGSYGRREPAPGSDLDLLLVHTESAAVVDTLAAALWYPLWDCGYRLDYAVRTVAQAVAEAGRDVRTAMGLLDARHVAGDPELTLTLRTSVRTDWRRHARRRLPELRAQVQARAARIGELAQLAEPDVKEAYGGLRDATTLRALVSSWLVDVPHQVVEPARLLLLDVRDALHEVTGRSTDRVLAEHAEDVATEMGLAADRDGLLQVVYGAGRDLAHASDAAWRRVGAQLGPGRPMRRRSGTAGPQLTSLAAGVGVLDGEVVLYPDATPERDPLLGLRAAVAAAQAGLPLTDAVCMRLARAGAPMPVPWPAEGRRLLCALLGSGQGLPDVWESLDRAGAVQRWLPEWAGVRMLPPRSAVHRYTVDRHLVQTCVQAAREQGRVRRPDLLVVAALVHDLGKARAFAGAEHSAAGATVAFEVARRWGFDEADAGTVELLVRHHLLLVRLATTRDVTDPATAAAVVGAVGAADTLDLLVALTVADARATGPLAASSWRLALVGALAGRVRAELAGAWTPPPDRPISAPPSHGGVGLRVVFDGVPEFGQPEPGAGSTPAPALGDSVPRLVIAVPDRAGALATVAGVLALDRLPVRQAIVHPGGEHGSAGLSEWLIGDSAELDPVLLRERIAVALRDDGRAVARRLARRDDPAPAHPTPVNTAAVNPAGPTVLTVPYASADATVLEVRASDRPGLLHQVCRALARLGADIRSAHVATLGAVAVDVFYVTDRDGHRFGADAAVALVAELTRELVGPPRSC